MTELVGKRRVGRRPAEFGPGLSCAGALIEQQDFSELVTQAPPGLLFGTGDRSGCARGDRGRLGQFSQGRVHSVADDVAAGESLPPPSP